MSVLVKGIDMPKSCGECHFLAYPFNVPVCSVTREIFTFPLNRSLRQVLQERKSNCPLVKVDETAILDGWDKVYPDDDEVEPRYCDRNICASNEVNGIGCDECPMGKEKNK